MTIWTVNLDKNVSRSHGRAIPKRFAVPSPSVNEIAEICEKFNLNPEVFPDKKYPRRWWVETGYVEVDKKMPKSRLLVKISNVLMEIREQKGARKRKGSARRR